jgi:hypothetical protein
MGLLLNDSNGNKNKKIQLRDNDTLCIWFYEYSNDQFLLKEKIQNNWIPQIF